MVNQAEEAKVRVQDDPKDGQEPGRLDLAYSIQYKRPCFGDEDLSKAGY